MKTNYLLNAIFILCLTFSCSTDAIAEDEMLTNSTEEKMKGSSEDFNAKTNCGSIIPILISDGPNVPSGNPTVYVTAGVDLRNYARQVTVTVLNEDDNALLDQLNLVIPANQNLSNFLPTLTCYDTGEIQLSVTSVINLSNFSSETCYHLTDMIFPIPECPIVRDPRVYILL
jgi:hypothetical protein